MKQNLRKGPKLYDLLPVVRIFASLIGQLDSDPLCVLLWSILLMHKDGAWYSHATGDHTIRGALRIVNIYELCFLMFTIK